MTILGLIIFELMHLPDYLKEKYSLIKSGIEKRLEEFSEKKSSEDLFYELCFCICTPQSKAENAFLVEKKLRQDDFLRQGFDPVALLMNKKHYIRFHNQKAQRLLDARLLSDKLAKIMLSPFSAQEKRIWLKENFKGLGMKEASHYLRNTGNYGVAILDRHILKHLVECGVFAEIPKISSTKDYLAAEQKFFGFAVSEGIPADHLDLLFWSQQAGKILK